MSFETSSYLGKATSRAKSDVANKLVSMFLHDVSKRLCLVLGVSVTDSSYTSAVAEYFGGHCAYCGTPLEHDRVAVEHLDGMNRLRGGLHIPGNVVVSCKRCNGEKRRDDSLKDLMLADTGWESFLAHDGKRCRSECKTCHYWQRIWPDENERSKRLREACNRITAFRTRYPKSLELCEMARSELRAILDSLYRECQNFATERINAAIEESLHRLVK